MIPFTKPTSYAAGELLGRHKIAGRLPNETGVSARKVHIFEFWNDSTLGCTKLNARRRLGPIREEQVVFTNRYEELLSLHKMLIWYIFSRCGLAGHSPAHAVQGRDSGYIFMDGLRRNKRTVQPSRHEESIWTRLVRHLANLLESSAAVRVKGQVVGYVVRFREHAFFVPAEPDYTRSSAEGKDQPDDPNSLDEA